MQHRSGGSGRRWSRGRGLILVGMVLGLLGGIVSPSWAGQAEPQVVTLTVGGPPVTLPPGTYQVGDAVIVVPVGGAAQVAVDATGAGIVRSVGANPTTVTLGGVTATVPPGSEIAARTNPATGRTDVVALIGTSTVQAGDATVTLPAGAGVGMTVNATTGAATLQATGTGSVTVGAAGTTAVLTSGTVALVDQTAPGTTTIVVAQGSAQVTTTGGGTTTVGAGQQVTSLSTATSLTTATATVTPTIPALTVPLPTLAGPPPPGGPGGGKAGPSVPIVVAFRETPVSPFQ